MSTKTQRPVRKQPEAHARRIYLLVNRETGKAFDCALTRKEATARRKAFAHRFGDWTRLIRIIPAQATPDA